MHKNTETMSALEMNSQEHNFLETLLHPSLATSLPTYSLLMSPVILRRGFCSNKKSVPSLEDKPRRDPGTIVSRQKLD